MEEKLQILRGHSTANFWLRVSDGCEVIYSNMCTMPPEIALLVGQLDLITDTYMTDLSPRLRFFKNR